MNNEKSAFTNCHTDSIGIWSPICGGWLRVVNYEANLSTQDLVKLAVQADELGYHFYAVHGSNYNVADAWIRAALASLNTKNIKIVAAVQPGFKLPAVVAKLSANIQNQLSTAHHKKGTEFAFCNETCPVT